MASLAAHYAAARQRYPQGRLMIVFDIDGTVLDMRYMVFQVLRAYDRAQRTNHFDDLHISDITEHENHVDRLLARLRVPAAERDKILNWYLARRWSEETMLNAHRAFPGVLEIIHWFQAQSRTFIGLNTGRPEMIRVNTRQSLNRLGEAYGVYFNDALLYMNANGWEQEVANSKALGVRYFQQIGYHVFAIVDNELENLKAVSNVDPGGEILLLHADTITESQHEVSLLERVVSGTDYDLAALIANYPTDSR
jgi:hypothetical protein